VEPEPVKHLLDLAPAAGTLGGNSVTDWYEYWGQRPCTGGWWPPEPLVPGTLWTYRGLAGPDHVQAAAWISLAKPPWQRVHGRVPSCGRELLISAQIGTPTAE